MKQKIEKVKTFVKEHEKEILIGTGMAVASGLIFIITRKKLDKDGSELVIRTF